jgi:hypothetical protein
MFAKSLREDGGRGKFVFNDQNSHETVSELLGLGVPRRASDAG